MNNQENKAVFGVFKRVIDKDGNIVMNTKLSLDDIVADCDNDTIN